METNNLILVEHICTNWKIEPAFIDSLQEFGLIDVILVEENKYLPSERVKDLEKMIRFHYELNINMEGIDAISNLLKQIDELQHELMMTKSKLKPFDAE